MCNCIKEVSNKALEHAQTQLNKSNQERILPLQETWNYGIENVTFGLNRTADGQEVSGLRLKTNLIFQTDFVKKDGNRSKPKNNHMGLLFSYCPFCGEGYNLEKAENESSETETK